MPRKHLRSVESSYELEEKPADSIDIAEDLNSDRFTDYDPEAYYLRASDYQGHAKNVQISLPTNWAPAIQRIVDSDRNPIRNAADLARHGLVHAIVGEIRKLGLEDDEEVTEWFTRYRLRHAADEQRERMSYLNDLETTCQLMVETMDWMAMHQVLYDATQLEWPKGLATKRDEIVRRYREKFPPNFNPQYAPYMDI